jgi:C-terminal processing protease CtpA/Prc
VDRVERLAGNVGYLALREFAEPEGAAPVFAAAMTLLARTDALIIDLRSNGGGYPPAGDLLASYLVGPRPVHLLSFHYRPTDQTFESWTRDTVAGPRYGPARPVYVLTGRGTASGAEAFAYTLRHLGRVTVVGDTTAGAAHPGRDRRVGHGFAVFVPDGRPTNPLTGGNWEGTGVAPDIAVPVARALQAAHAAALRTLAEGTHDPARRREFHHALDAVIASTANRVPR